MFNTILNYVNMLVWCFSLENVQFTMSRTADNTKACNDKMLMMHIIQRHIYQLTVSDIDFEFNPL